MAGRPNAFQRLGDDEGIDPEEQRQHRQVVGVEPLDLGEQPAAVQQRVDARRIAYLRSLCAAAGHPAPDRLATAIYVMLIGAAHLTPPLPKAELQELYRDLVLPLIDAPALPTAER